VPGGRRDSLLRELKANGISAAIHYPIPLPFLNAYSHLAHRKGDFPESEKASKEILSLPMFPELTDEQIHYVARTITNAFA
jgi:dTDP-4-amino-4,6-dideoxygalactose transaminase